MSDDKIIIIAEEKAKEIIALAEDKARQILQDASVASDEKMKDFLFMAVQSGKSETSGLVALIMNKIDKNIGEAVEKHVNGKIIHLTDNLNTYIVEDTEWKKEYEPYLKGLANVSGSAKILIWFAVSCSTIGGAYLMLKKIFE